MNERTRSRAVELSHEISISRTTRSSPEAAARRLVEAGVALVGIDSLNVDSLTDPARPAHTVILEAGIPLVEHLTGLGQLAADGSRFFPVPPRIRGMATFPVRAFALIG